MNNLIRPVRPRSHNRLAAVASHTVRYAFKAGARLAEDAGVARSSVWRLLEGRTLPTYRLVTRLTRCLEGELGRKLDLREIVSDDGHYPTKYICDVVGCPGCMPPQAYSGRENVRVAYAGVEPGRWTGDNLEALEPERQEIEEVR